MKVSPQQLGSFAAGAVVGGLAVGLWSVRRDPVNVGAASLVSNKTQPTALPQSYSHSYRSEIGDDLGRFEQMGEVGTHRAVENLDGAALLDLVIDIGKQSFSNGGTFFRQKTIVARLAELDPEAALRFVSEPGNQRLFRSVAGVLAQHHPERALELLGEVNNQEQRTDIINAIASVGTQEGGMELLAVLGDRDRVDLRSDAASSLGESFDEANLDQGLAFMAKISDVDGQMDFFDAMIANVADGNPQLALQLWESHGPKAKQHTHVIKSLAEGWIKHDPAGARAWLSTLVIPDQRIGVMRAFLESAKRDGASHAWLGDEIAQFVEGGERAKYLVADYSLTLAADDPKAALEWIRGLPSEATSYMMGNHRITDSLYAAWVRDDPDGAIGYLESLDPSDPIYDNVAEEMLERLADSDPAGAAAYALGIENEPNTTPLGPVIRSWAEQDPIAAEQWVTDLRGTDHYVGAIDALVGRVARDDPEHAAAMLGNAMRGLDQTGLSGFSESMEVVGKWWAESDPAAAVAWAIKLPPSSGNYRRPQIVGGIFKEWIEFDRHAAASWLAGIEPGHQRDTAVRVLIEDIRETDPEAAFQWAMSVSGEYSKNRAMGLAIEPLRSRDEEAARAVVESSGVSDEEREAFLLDW